MIEYTATKTFRVTQETTEDMWYRIRIYDAMTGKQHDEIWYPTMERALKELAARGYQRKS